MMVTDLKLSDCLVAITEENDALKKRNQFLEVQYELILQRLEAFEYHSQDEELSFYPKLKRPPQQLFILNALMARYPKHVRAAYLAENMPSEMRNRPDSYDINHLNVLVSLLRRWFRCNDIPISIKWERELQGYVISQWAYEWIKAQTTKN